ncbi:hypothetical protein IQ22_01506 [Pseudomonas duriflava]|uniref:Exopolysaccharide synthesis protein ExoD n=1 Tax=Pseudomonas duriflava TaxID=459528 RepID=A0A562QHA9_9PSED|nr:exopolysaccharide biosynthesis protein [Pseudomonas duriflava]TWI55580.1 hypothetical protein IQ22_01506 [Pseudomonas duriflava]
MSENDNVALEDDDYACAPEDDSPINLETFLTCLEEVGRSPEKVSVRHLIDAIGSRSFGPLILLAGLIALSPLTGIPGIATLVSVYVVLVSGQLLLGRRHFWLPRWVLKRQVPRNKLRKSLRLLHPVARVVDRFLQPRLTFLTKGLFRYLTALLCILIALSMPVLDLVPFANTTAGAALTAFALSLIARDGFLFLLASGFCVGIIWIIVRLLL